MGFSPSPTSGNRAPTRSRRARRRCAPPRMPASSTSSGPRFPMSKRSAAENTMSPTSPIKPRWMPSSRPPGSVSHLRCRLVLLSEPDGGHGAPATAGRLHGMDAADRPGCACHSRRRHHRTREDRRRRVCKSRARRRRPVSAARGRSAELQRHRRDAQRTRPRLHLPAGPREVFATFFPGAGELTEMFGYFEKHTYLGGKFDDQIRLAN